MLYPDVVSLVRRMFARAHDLQSFIIDVAIDPDDGSLRSFQELSNRERMALEVRDIKVTVCVFAFDSTVRPVSFHQYHDVRPRVIDVLHQILLGRLFRERRDILRTRFPALTPGEQDQLALITTTPAKANKDENAFWQTAVESRCEGLMIKVGSQMRHCLGAHSWSAPGQRQESKATAASYV